MSGSVGTLAQPADWGQRLLCTIASLCASLCHGPLAYHPQLRGPYISSMDILLAYLLCWNISTMSSTSGGFQVILDQKICLRGAHFSYCQPQSGFPIHGDSAFKDQISLSPFHLNRAVNGSRQVVALWSLFPKGGGEAGGWSLLEVSYHTTPLPGMNLTTTNTDEPKPRLDRGQDWHLGWAETAQEPMCWLSLHQKYLR